MAEETTTTQATEQVTEQTTEQAKTEKTFTQSDVNALVAGTRKEAHEKLYKKYGFEDEKSFDAYLKQAKAADDAKKDEAQKAKELAENANKQLAEVQARADRAEAKAEALALGVATEKIDRFMRIALTYDGETVADKVKAAIADNPEFKATDKPQSFGAATKGQDTSRADKLAEIKKAMGVRT